VAREWLAGDRQKRLTAPAARRAELRAKLEQMVEPYGVEVDRMALQDVTPP
jgi:hypothetical protein